MTPIEPPPLRPAKRRLPLWVKLLCVVGVLFLVLLISAAVAFFSYASGVRTELAEVEAAVRAAGYPVDADELAAYYPEIPDEENGAPIYDQAYEALSTAPVEREAREVLWERVSSLEPGVEIPPELLDDMRGQTAAVSATLDLLQKAATYDRVRFPIELALSATVEWSHISDFREFSQLLCIAGLVAAHDADWGRFVALHNARAHMIGTLNAEPVLLSKLMRSNLLRMSMTELGLVFSHWNIPPEALSELSVAYAASEGKSAAAEAIAVERCATVNMIAAVSKGRMESQDGPLSAISNQPGSAIGAGLVDQRTRLKLYRFTNPLVALGEKPWEAWIPETNAVSADLEAAGYTAPIANLVVPAFSRATTSAVRTAATIRMIQTSLAVERYREATGELPETLEALVPTYLAELPADPFDGELLRYRKKETGYTIYSVYEDLTDDGGEPMENRGPQERSAGDWVFSVVR